MVLSATSPSVRRIAEKLTGMAQEPRDRFQAHLKEFYPTHFDLAMTFLCWCGLRDAMANDPDHTQHLQCLMVHALDVTYNTSPENFAALQQFMPIPESRLSEVRAAAWLREALRRGR